MKRKTGVKFVSVIASSPQIGCTCFPNIERYVRLIWGGQFFIKKAQRIVTKHEKIQIRRIQTMNKRVFIPDKAHNLNLPPYLNTQCVCPSETFRTSYLFFSSVVFRETTDTEHTISVLFLVFLRRIVSEWNS
jgi:hypothetical protein